MSNCRCKRYKGKEGHQNNITEKRQTYETKINRNSSKIAGQFCIVLQMNKAREFSGISDQILGPMYFKES